MKDVVKVLRILQMIRCLSEGMTRGIVPFSKVSHGEPDCGRIVYDDNAGILVRDNDIFEYPVIFDSHYDVMSTYDDYCAGATVRLRIVPVEQSDDCVHVIIRFDGCSETVEIDNSGRWNCESVM